MKNVLILATNTLVGSTGVPHQCPSEVAMGAAAFTAFTQSFTSLKETVVDASSYLSDSAFSRFSRLMQGTDLSLPAEYDSIPDHLHRLIVMDSEFRCDRTLFKSVTGLLRSETTLPSHVQSRVDTLVSECDSNIRLFFDARKSCEEKQHL